METDAIVFLYNIRTELHLQKDDISTYGKTFTSVFRLQFQKKKTKGN